MARCHCDQCGEVNASEYDCGTAGVVKQWSMRKVVQLRQKTMYGRNSPMNISKLFASNQTDQEVDVDAAKKMVKIDFQNATRWIF